MVEFKEWPKIPRGKGDSMTITEKIDGTNACIIIEGGVIVGVQSRNRLISIHDDNYGFAQYVEKNKEELLKLGEGYHYGEWAGEGIQKNPHKIVGKKLFLFNSERWRDGRQPRPKGVECVPILWEGTPDKDTINDVMDDLWSTAAVEGYKPEGVIVWYHKTRRYEKYTFENSEGKWRNDE